MSIYFPLQEEDGENSANSMLIDVESANDDQKSSHGDGHLKTVSHIASTSEPGSNPANYNARVVKLYNATSSLVRFDNNNIFFSKTL
jgi:hypothetical protein